MMKTFATILVVLALATPAVGQRLYPVSGGTRIAPHTKEKKQIVLIAENEARRITLSTPEKYKVKYPILAIWMKIENLSSEPMDFAASKFSATDEEGRGYAGLEPRDAIKRVIDAHAGMMWVMGSVLAGPLAGPGLTAAAERKVTQEVMSRSIEAGTIPAHSFKEGMIFFEAPAKKKKFTFSVRLGDLWPEPFVLSTEKPRKK